MKGLIRISPLLGVLFALALPSAATAATIDVEIRTDEFNNDGECSLREAVEAANLDNGGTQTEDGCTAGSGADVIDLDAGAAYTLTTDLDTNTPDIDDGDLELTDPDGATVIGEGRATTIIDGGDEDRIFEVDAGSLTLNATTIRNGRVTTAAGGGGIHSQGGDVSLLAAGVIENEQTSAGPDGGGGMALLDEAALTASGDSVINDNVSAGPGGGIYKIEDGDITLSPGVSVNGNDGVGFGGGIYVSGNGALTINGASVSNNDLAEELASPNRAWGSAISYGGSGFNLTNATITGNDSIGDAAVAALEMFSGTAASTIDSSTISNNTVTGQVDGNGDVLGPAAIRSNASMGTTISNSTIAQNTVNSPDPPDVENGGAIYAITPLTITGSTFHQNGFSPGNSSGGGALYVDSTVGILNSTFTGNTDPSVGGAIRMQGGADVTIGQSTFSGNVSPQGTAIDVSNSVGTTLTLRGTVFDDGMGACQQNPPTVLTDDSFNVDAGTSCVEAADDSDFENTDALLDGLDDNGGPTETMQLLGPANLFNGAGACTLDAMTPLTVDQRGFTRPSEGACEPGAYERFICNGVELMQPGPFPGCPQPGGPGISPVNPPPAQLPVPRKKCKKGQKLKKGKCVKKKRKKR